MQPLLRAIAQGEPGTAKTGALAALMDAGYRVILADFDHNPEPLLSFSKHPERLHVVTFADDLALKSIGSGDRAKEVLTLGTGAVSAVRKFQKFCLNGNEALGAPKTWGPDTVFVLDSLTALAESAMHLALKLNNHITREGSHIGILGGEVSDALDLFMHPALGCHRYMTAHLKLISPKSDSSYGDQTDLQKKVLVAREKLEDTAFFPNMPGIAVSRIIASKFSTALLFEVGDEAKLVIRTKPIKGYTIKVPARVEDKLPAETGLLTIMEALCGAKAAA